MSENLIRAGTGADALQERARLFDSVK